MGEIAGALYGIETMIEGAFAAAKGIYDPTLPLKTTLVPIKDVNVARFHHTISVVKGRAYVFGGKVSSKGSESLADNDMHIIVLPSSGVESTDYQRIPADANAPPARFGHSAAVIDDQIYVCGGSNNADGSVNNENGIVWAFDTTTNRWSKLEPSSTTEPPANRMFHAATATEHPRQSRQSTDHDTMPQAPPDPARNDILPEPEAANSYGTLLIYGGVQGKEEDSTSLLAFDIASKTWQELSSPPTPAGHLKSPSLAIVKNRVYAVVAGQTYFLDLLKTTFNDKAGQGDIALAPTGPWSTMHGEGNAEILGPGERTGAAIIPVTTGQGRNYMLLLGGESPSKSTSSGTVHGDIWSLQLRPEGMTAASFKDAARMAISKPTGEEQWAEVKYYNTEGVIIQEGQPGRGIGDRIGFAAARGSEVDGCSVLVWGGRTTDGNVLGDGLMITVDR